MKRTPERIETLRTMDGNGANASAIARVIGVSSVCIANWAREELIPLPTNSQAMKALHADPEFKAHLIAARKGVPDIDIPKWVPRDLWVEYLDLASEAGEEFAASRVRRLKAEMQVSA